jgi:hypothetical protein
MTAPQPPSPTIPGGSGPSTVPRHFESRGLLYRAALRIEPLEDRVNFSAVSAAPPPPAGPAPAASCAQADPTPTPPASDATANAPPSADSTNSTGDTQPDATAVDNGASASPAAPTCDWGSSVFPDTTVSPDTNGAIAQVVSSDQTSMPDQPVCDDSVVVLSAGDVAAYGGNLNGGTDSGGLIGPPGSDGNLGILPPNPDPAGDPGRAKRTPILALSQALHDPAPLPMDTRSLLGHAGRQGLLPVQEMQKPTVNANGEVLKGGSSQEPMTMPANDGADQRSPGAVDDEVDNDPEVLTFTLATDQPPDVSPPPKLCGLMGDFLPVDWQVLEQGAQPFLDQLDQLGTQLASAPAPLQVLPWFTALMAGATALEIARRQLRPVPEAAGMSPEWRTSYGWLPTEPTSNPRP